MLQNVWWLLTMACVVWYSTVTIYISVHARHSRHAGAFEGARIAERRSLGVTTREPA